MRKLIPLLSAIFLVAFAIVLVNCGNDSHPISATSQFAFIRPAPAGGAAISPVLRHFQMEHRQAVSGTHRLSRGAGLKPMAVDVGPGTDSVVLMNNDGTGEQVIANQAGWFEAVQLGYDGKRGVASAEDLNGYLQVYYVDLTDKNNPTARQLTSDNADHWGAQISWDGKMAVFTKYVQSAGTWQLVTVPTSGGTEKVIPTSFEANYPTFAPNGNIVFENDDTDTIVMIKADGSGLTTITSETDTEHSDWAPSVSPDGKTVVLSRMGDIYSVSISGGAVKQLTTNGESWDPMVVKDKIVYLSWPASASSDEIFSMNMDGGNQKQLTTNSLNEYFEGGWD